MLNIIWNVTPNQVLTDTIPRRTFSPQHPGVESLNCRVAYLVFSKARIEYHYIFIGISNRRRVLTVVACLTQTRCGKCGSESASDESASSQLVRWILILWQGITSSLKSRSRRT